MHSYAYSWLSSILPAHTLPRPRRAPQGAPVSLNETRATCYKHTIQIPDTIPFVVLYAFTHTWHCGVVSGAPIFYYVLQHTVCREGLNLGQVPAAFTPMHSHGTSALGQSQHDQRKIVIGEGRGGEVGRLTCVQALQHIAATNLQGARQQAILDSGGAVPVNVKEHHIHRFGASFHSCWRPVWCLPMLATHEPRSPTGLVTSPTGPSEAKGRLCYVQHRWVPARP